MTLKSTLTTGYYALLTVIVIGQVVFTVLQTSLVIDHSQQLKSLELRQQALLQQKQQLQVSLATKQSLAALAHDPELELYQTITRPIVVDVSANLAAR